MNIERYYATFVHGDCVSALTASWEAALDGIVNGLANTMHIIGGSDVGDFNGVAIDEEPANVMLRDHMARG